MGSTPTASDLVTLGRFDKGKRLLGWNPLPFPTKGVQVHGVRTVHPRYTAFTPQKDPHRKVPDSISEWALDSYCYFLMGYGWMDVELKMVEGSSIMNHHLPIHLILYA